MIGIIILTILFFVIIFLLLVDRYEKYSGKSLQNELSGLQWVSIVSALWILSIIILSVQEKSNIKLNEWGDFLAGFFAPVLFIWLVYGVFLQKEEFGNIVESFSLQKEEFTKSVSAMESQVTQVEVQQLNIWFNRNIQTINTIKKTLFSTINDQTIDSISLINQKLKEDFTKEKDFFHIFDELKSILDIFIYMNEHLKQLEKTKSNNNGFIIAIKDLKKEFTVLYMDDYNNIKEIMALVYIFIVIAIKGNEDYKLYINYSSWVTVKEEDIYNIVLENNKGDFTLTMEEIIKNLQKISQTIDFKTGDENGRF